MHLCFLGGFKPYGSSLCNAGTLHGLQVVMSRCQAAPTL